MKKIISFVIAILIIFNASSILVFAEEDVGNIKDVLPNETIEILEQNGFDTLDINTLKNLSLSDVLKYLENLIKTQINTPFLLIYAIFIITLIITLVRGVNGGLLSTEIDNNLGIVGILSLCTTILTPIISCITETKTLLDNLSAFTKTFVPVLTGVMVSAGQGTSGLGYQTIMLTAVEILSSFLSSVIIPLLFVFLAISITGKISNFINLNSIATTVKTTINWALGLSVGLFIALITIKGLIGTGADSLALRTGRYFIGSFVPAVGSALSEAAATAIKGVGIIKNTTGVFGIIAATLYILPPLIKILLYKFTCDISTILGEMLGAEKMCAVIRDISIVLGLLSSIILSYGAIIILSTAITLIIGGNI